MTVRLETSKALDGRDHWSLTVGRVYEVLGIACDDYRLLDDTGEPVVFDRSCFSIVDPTEPSNWVSEIDDGARYACPPGWDEPGFFEDWHDGVPKVRESFWKQLEEWHPATAAAPHDRDRRPPFRPYLPGGC